MAYLSRVTEGISEAPSPLGLFRVGVGVYRRRRAMPVNGTGRAGQRASRQQPTTSALATGTSKNIRLRRDDRQLSSPRDRFNGRRPLIEAI